MKPFPAFETSRLLLRSLLASDAAGVFSIYSNPEVTKFSEMATLLNFSQAGQIIKRFQFEFEQDLGMRWAIALKSDARVIGTCGLGWHRPNFSAYLSYDLAEEAWGRGFATEALQPVVRFAFAANELNRLSATTIPDNTASIRVLKKLGFQEEGILREWAFWKGKFQDLRCFSLLRNDLERISRNHAIQSETKDIARSPQRKRGMDGFVQGKATT
jgi:ribosomal-protein-alanine N-acetyltransferase